MKIDLSKITNPNDIREMCRAPLRLKDGRVVATCGVKLVCVASFDGDAAALMAAPERQDETICKLLAAHGDAKQWLPVSSLILPALDSCPHCGGHGHVTMTECEECDGEGEFEHGRHTYECKECDGDGESSSRPCGPDDPEGKECFKCSGSGYKPTPAVVPGLPPGVGANVAELARFPVGAEISAVPYGQSHMIALRGDGWIGVLSPMRVQP